jgi:hypothetical protein
MTTASLPLAVASSNGKLLWYVTRGTGVVALVLLSAGVLLGVMSSTRWHPPRTPRFLVLGLHRNVTLLGLAFVVVHVITTVADHFAPIGYQDAVLIAVRGHALFVASPRHAGRGQLAENARVRDRMRRGRVVVADPQSLPEVAAR